MVERNNLMDIWLPGKNRNREREKECVVIIFICDPPPHSLCI
jgi:hypothetical protein